MRLITACILIDEMSNTDVWRFWATNERQHYDYCHVAYGYPYECVCRAPAWWVFPYDVRFTHGMALAPQLLTTVSAPPNVKPKVDDWLDTW